MTARRTTGAELPVMQRYLSGHEAATYLGITYVALRKRVERGELPVIRDGRWLKFDRFDLDALMASKREEAWAS